jgi:hypothetical protein
MTWRALVVAVLAWSCGGTRALAPPEQVPASYQAVAASAGHVAHVGKVACEDCHDEAFHAPSPTTCLRCHTDKPTSALHPRGGGPGCLDCHAFRNETKPSCLDCHTKPQPGVPAIGLHSDQPCGDCHRAHDTPALAPRTCTECHAANATAHAGKRGCLDCHRMHEPLQAPAAECARCHASLSGPRQIGGTAITTGHTRCTQCHAPHDFTAVKVKPCATCHADQPVLAPDKHTCQTCHAPHDDAPKPCTACHAKSANHASGSCLGCHPPHDRSLPIGKRAADCASCHPTLHHATAPCLDCHTPHTGKPTFTATACAKCHGDHAQTTAASGHADCLACHGVHAPRPAPPTTATCASCHADKAATTHDTGHATCASCHRSGIHAPKAPPPSCASCHRSEAEALPDGHARCESCHKPHDPRAAKPACTSCHDRGALPGLHAVDKHADCESCHSPHAQRGRSDRTTCLACHKDRAGHEPTAKSCAACHPFAAPK